MKSRMGGEIALAALLTLTACNTTSETTTDGGSSVQPADTATADTGVSTPDAVAAPDTTAGDIGAVDAVADALVVADVTDVSSGDADVSSGDLDVPIGDADASSGDFDVPSGDADVSSGDTGPDTKTGNPPECPDEAPAWGSQVDCAPLGLVCTYPAYGCADGAKPDNTWTCTAQGFLAYEQPFHHCSLLFNFPKHRPDAPACESAPTTPGECVVSQPGSYESTCTSQAECSEGQVCLDTVKFGSETACECFDPGCVSDAECGADEVCVCGKLATSGTSPCGGWSGKPCGNRCTAAACHTDADCGEGKVCSPSDNLCGWQIESFHCHDPATDACLSDLECETYEQCRFTEAEGWHCEGKPTCD